MHCYHLLPVMLAAWLLCGCATAPAPVNPAFQQLSDRICALVRRDFPDAEITAHPNYLATSYRMAPKLDTPPESRVYVWIHFVQATGLKLEMYPVEARVLDLPPPHPESFGEYYPTGYAGYAYLAGTRQPVCIHYYTGSRAPKGFNRAMKSLIRRSTTPYHQSTLQASTARHGEAIGPR